MAAVYDFLASLSMWEIAALFGACYTLVSIAAIPLRRWLVGRDDTGHHEALDAVFSSVSSLYAILLGLILVAAWQNFQDAEAEQIDEGNRLVSLFRLSGGLSEPEARKIRLSLFQYAQSTVGEEWAWMDSLYKRSEGQTTGTPKAFAFHNELWAHYVSYAPKDTRDELALNYSMQELIKLSEDRRSRLLDAKPYLPADVWRLLFGGAVVVMVMAALFTQGRNGLFAVMSFALGASIAFELAVVISVDHPYAGRTVVEPNALRNAVQVMRHLALTEGLTLDVPGPEPTGSPHSHP
jgi:hypothetical protein